jgi:hypothetical protein
MRHSSFVIARTRAKSVVLLDDSIPVLINHISTPATRHLFIAYPANPLTGYRQLL